MTVLVIASFFTRMAAPLLIKTYEKSTIPLRFERYCAKINFSVRVHSLNGVLFYFLNMLMQIFLFRCHSSTNMPLRLIYIQHLPCPVGKRGINLHQPFCDILMYRTLTHSKCFCSLSYRCIMLNNITCNIHGTFFNISLQLSPSYMLFNNV